jgi:hypothetical protein
VPVLRHPPAQAAPKLEKGGIAGPVKARRKPPMPSLGKLKPARSPASRADLSLRPYATIALVLTAALLTIGWRAGIYSFLDSAIAGPIGADYHKLLTSSFVYAGTGYELVALVPSGCSVGCSNAGTGSGRRSWSTSSRQRLERRSR